MSLRLKTGLVVFAFAALSWTSIGLGQSPSPAPVSGPLLPEQRPLGNISGTVIDRSGAVVAGASVKLQHQDQSPEQSVVSGADGNFGFANVVCGPFQITITGSGFAAQSSSGILHPGENYMVPPIALSVATAVTEVQVSLTQMEIAQEEIKLEEKQRVLGVIPNFYVSYVPNAAPLNPRQKFELAWKTVVDPVTFLLVGAVAGVQQAQNHFSEYGQGAQGYGKRFGAGYADTVTGTFLGGAVLPSILKQDPRYFYKGTGGIRSRALYAIANSVICRGDNGRWQANYSNILGNLAAGGISNLYYPPQDRNGAGLTFENGAIGIGSTAIANLFQEFLIKKLTPKIANRDPGQLESK